MGKELGFWKGWLVFDRNGEKKGMGKERNGGKKDTKVTENRIVTLAARAVRGRTPVIASDSYRKNN